MILSDEQVQRRCDYCDDDGMVEMDNNGPIGTCPVCQGTKRLRDASNEPPATDARANRGE